MEKFLNDLRNALNSAKIENVDEILTTYLEHFALGHEAGMSDEEIIERFDSIEDIVWKYRETESREGYSLELDLSYFSDFQIHYSEKTKGIRFDIDEGVLDYVEILREGKSISLKNKKNVIFSKRKKYDGSMLVGTDVIFHQFKLNNLNCDVNCKQKLNCINIHINNVSGDINFTEISAAESSIITTTTGDISITKLLAPKVKLSSVSGDISISDFTCDEVKINTVSGDVKIEHSNEAEFQISSISGDVIVQAGVDPSMVKASCVSGSIKIGDEIVSKSISEILKNYKW